MNQPKGLTDFGLNAGTVHFLACLAAIFDPIHGHTKGYITSIKL